VLPLCFCPLCMCLADLPPVIPPSRS
jgi:hypothetical protein